MDKLSKFLGRLSESERQSVVGAIALLLEGRVNGLDIKKLKGFDDVYRARVGSIRVIFRQTSGDTKILEIERRGEKTYRKF